jgi:hypothetical protein
LGFSFSLFPILELTTYNSWCFWKWNESIHVANIPIANVLLFPSSHLLQEMKYNTGDAELRMMLKTSNNKDRQVKGLQELEWFD